MSQILDLPLSAPPAIASIGRAVHQPSQAGRYLLPAHWCLHAYRWKGSVEVDGRPLAIRPGSLHLTPPNRVLVYAYDRDSRHLSVHFQLGSGSERWPAQEMQFDRPDFAAIERQLEQALMAFRSTPQHAQAMLWSVLWQLVEPAAVPSGTAADPRFEAVCAQIELHLVEVLSVPVLAAAVGLSHNQLTRLFQRHARNTVVGYIRARRMERACHLLRHTTHSIAAVGAAVGIADPHVFNKCFRRELHCSPRGYREAGRSHVQYPLK